MQGAFPAPNARAISCTVAALVTMGCVALILSSAGDQDIATMELGQEWDPQGPTDAGFQPTPDDDVQPTPDDVLVEIDPTALPTSDAGQAYEFGRDGTVKGPVDSKAPVDPTALKVPETDPTAKAVKKPTVAKKASLVETETDAKTKVKATVAAKAAKKGVNRVARMQRNLVDLRAFLDVARDDIEDLEEYGGEESAIIKPMVDELRKVKLEELVQGWENFAKLMQKRNPLPASLAHYMMTFMTKQLETSQGLLSISERSHGRHVRKYVGITGAKVGLEATPSIWHKLMRAKLDKVLAKAHAYRRHLQHKDKKKEFQLSLAAQKVLWGHSCVDDESYGESYSMGCSRHKTKKLCHQSGGCVWRTAWHGQ